MANSYEDTEVYKLSKRLAVVVHRVTLHELPKFEMYEQGSQIRRAAKSIVANFVEGYGRQLYPADFIRHLTYAIASCDETKAHLEMLYETESLTQERFQDLYGAYRQLGRKLYNFRQTVIEQSNDKR